ncbi:MAG: leucine-rich repeat domain-containing protein [Saprospiraceae bacterium]|nr:leucine-rich repeat domain-containing protein [Saprospiraceae bacterium]MCB9325524.1 leucine-rich repeat domain-containing protein [Lewinellaceae bacterium]
MRFNDLQISSADLPKVTELFLYWGRLDEIPDMIFRMPNLVHLNLEGNRITELPCALKDCVKLKKLELGTNKIESAESLQFLPPNLKKLDLNNNKIGEIPPAITQLKHLEELCLIGSGISKIPGHIKKLKALKKLELFDNDIKIIPVAIGKLTNLRELSVGKNKLTKIPDALGYCQKLSSLKANENRINEVSNALEGCVELNYLDLSSNKLTTLPAGLNSCLTLQTLKLSHNKFTAIPACILDMQWLSKLLLNKNGLTEIDFRRQCRRLSFLDLSDNKIDTIKNLPASLEWLHLIHNKLDHFPHAILECSGLKNLFMRNNRIKELPEGLGVLQNSLKVIDLAFNPVKAAPEQLLHFKGLEGVSGLTKKTEALALISVLEASRYHLITANEHFFFLNLLLNRKNERGSPGLSSLVSFLNVRNPIAIQKVRKYLYGKAGIPLSRKRLKKGDQLAVLGSTKFNDAELQDRLGAHGITFLEEVNENTTHVLLGWKAYGFFKPLSPESVFSGKKQFAWPEGISQPIVFLSEQRLWQEIWRLEQAHLLENPDAKIFQSIKDLLLSREEVNVRLGIELLKGGGIPQEFLTYLMITWLRTGLSDPELKKEAFRLLFLNVEDDWKFVLETFHKAFLAICIRDLARANEGEVVPTLSRVVEEIKKFLQVNHLDVGLIKKALFKK